MINGRKLKSGLKALFVFGFLIGVLSLAVKDSQAQEEPSLLFSATSKTVRVGESFSIDVIVDTAGQGAHGAGTKISFDPGVLEVISIQPGTIFGDYPVASYDNATGKIIVSGIASSIRNEFIGRGVFATLTFRGINKGGTSIKFSFEPGSTRDSNIAVTESVGDILSRVDSLLVTVSSGTGGTISAPTTAATQPVEVSISQDSEVSLFTRLLRFLGFKKEPAVGTIDARDPIPLQAPKTDANQSQPVSSFVFSEDNLLLRIAKILLVIFVVIFLVFIGKRILSKARKKKATVVHGTKDNQVNQG